MEKRTPLFEAHKRLHAKMVSFAGYEMPISYSGIIEEHNSVRNSAGLFDVSHMGEFIFQGAKALEQIQHITTNDASGLDIYQAQYSMICREDGGIIDDVLVYRLPDRYLMVVNASNREKDFAWVNYNLINGAEVRDVSDEYALIAVQGPESIRALQELTSIDISKLSYYCAVELELAGIPLLCSRTGYTGEIGCELYVTSESALQVWERVLDAGHQFGMLPAGLGARDSLRLEKCFRLYGSDMDETINPFEAGLGRWVKLDKNEFIGKETLANVKREGISRKLVGFTAEKRVIPRHGYAILKEGRQIGTVTSGLFSPSLKKGIGMGYVKEAFCKIGTDLEIDVRGRTGIITVLKMPFV